MSMKSILFVLVAVFFVSASVVKADGNKKKNWDKNHPRRAQVNGRLNNQQKRVDNGLANGKLSPQQAQKIQNQDASIRNQERRDAAANGGHITKSEQRQLNHEENGVSHEINRDERRNSAGQPPAGAPPAAAPPAGAPPVSSQ